MRQRSHSRSLTVSDPREVVQVTSNSTRAFIPQHNEPERAMNKDQVKGRAKQIKGKIKEIAGRTVGNPRVEAQGDVDQLAGTVQKA